MNEIESSIEELSSNDDPQLPVTMIHNSLR